MSEDGRVAEIDRELSGHRVIVRRPMDPLDGRAVRGAHMTPFPLVSAGFGVPNTEEKPSL
jgi:hypothetical protein